LGKSLKLLSFPAFFKTNFSGAQNSTEKSHLRLFYHFLVQKVHRANRAKIPENFFLAP